MSAARCAACGADTFRVEIAGGEEVLVCAGCGVAVSTAALSALDRLREDVRLLREDVQRLKQGMKFLNQRLR
ncbi:MAG: hypothetical protein ABR599_07430 [Gemmatimonadota bacterium]